MQTQVHTRAGWRERIQTCAAQMSADVFARACHGSLSDLMKVQTARNRLRLYHRDVGVV